MKNLIIITLLLVTATALAASKQYYSYPDATQLKDSDRLLIYQNASGSKNLTGAGLKSVISQTAWPEGSPRVFQAVTSSSISNQIVNAIRDRRGIIKYITFEGGQQFFGVPWYNHTYVYPFDNMTNVSRTTPLVIGSRWLTRGFVGKNITIPGGPSFVAKALYYGGMINGLPNFGVINPDAAQTTQDAFYWGTESVGLLAANTTYTIRSALASEWNGRLPGVMGIGNDPCTYALANTSSARVMINYSSVLCRSTFRTGN